MDEREFLYVLKVAEEKSISEAARKLFISQPSLSQYIKKIEYNIDEQLFIRTHGGFKLTHAGRKYLEYSKKIIDLKKGLSKEINDIKNLKTGEVIIGVPVYRGSYILPTILPHFYKKYPNISVKVIEENSERLEQMVLNGDIELAFLCLPIISDELSYDILVKEELLVAFSSNNSLYKSLKKEKRNSLSIKDLVDEKFILLKKGQRIRYYIDELFEELKCSPKIILETKSIDTAKRLSALGVGITIMPDTYANYFRTKINPCYIPLDTKNKERTLVLAYNNNYYQSKSLIAFKEMAIDKIKETLGSPFPEETLPNDFFP